MGQGKRRSVEDENAEEVDMGWGAVCRLYLNESEVALWPEASRDSKRSHGAGL